MSVQSTVSNWAVLTEQRLNELMPCEDNLQKEIFDACRYSLLAGGKRLRPALCMIFYHLCGGSADSAIDFASGIEMIHSYSLIHDDLPCMDDSDYRRGRLSCHRVYGYSTAMLAGDALLNRAFEIMSQPLSGVDPKCQMKALHTVATASGLYGMVGGQVIDLALEGKSCTEDQLWKMIELKTAVMIAGACESGCRLAGADEETAKAAYEYGRAIGLAFQIRDDVLDVTGDAALVGKPVGEDGESGKNTFVSMYGVEKCNELIAELTDKAIRCTEAFANGDELREIALWLTDRQY
ncbi:MAG: polyprenyl synthetase family protein [Ruminococcaceae bacterium]|nr:polyprenyl synthetase family protein [Oscillospiraceae bacterium]